VLAYLLAFDLVTVSVVKNVEHFGLTEAGSRAAKDLATQPSYEKLVKRAKILQRTFGSMSGTSVKNFIYTEFPEVVSLPLGETIS
jgi:pantoate kinase